MTAAQLVEPGRVELVRTRRPSPGAGQVRIALEGCGVCASNLPAWSGRPWFDYPLPPGALGHEGWGRVEAIGPGVDPAWEGVRVAAASEHAYAEADVADADDLITLSPDLAMAPLEPFGCVFNVADRAALAAGQTVAVVGLGFIGLGVARLAAEAGARVFGISSSAAARQLAAQHGAEQVMAMSGRGEMGQIIGELSGGMGCDRVVECTGHQAPLDLAGDLVREGGRLMIAGFHQDGPRQVDLQQWNWKGIDVINAHERSRERIRGGMRAAARALENDASWVRELVTDALPLARLDQALCRASERPAGFVKAAVLTDGAGA